MEGILFPENCLRLGEDFVLTMFSFLFFLYEQSKKADVDDFVNDGSSDDDRPRKKRDK